MEFSSPDQFQEYAQGSGHSFVSIGLSQNSEELGSMLIELYTDVTPATCEHFMKGCKSTFAGGYKYESSPIHRVVKHGYIQGGDVVEGTGKGNPGFSIPDETFQIKHEEVGMIGMANNNEPHTAATQFYITLNPLSWLDGKRVVFGKVIDKNGLDLLRRVESLNCNNERPIPEILISKAEVLFEAPVL
mmetsp:Transcript_14942/g.40305  ORF Transcript_14942/g.40305 Transcript_14942/m.40305 type:complete len:188 (+) Transcript_14942:3668-4231(+)|eukprot:CAMPEP_0202358220 /NCGR_PEP_ID=MMETSP1126-20121109/11963_1 /ASSEMBLY_ACC=CAM_ASM_000457 /TAXON_ID=3047 /ORGANISM="Dunaliella tertiolecta, Strain CCMP1320" /LENGTH=187 /DNA_ID=CAMNT_0048951315 /DNA_START=32 /DNA_END=595 /DNA_ORIENTATION=-